MLDSGASVGRVPKGIAQVRAALRNLSDCNAKFIQSLEGDDMPDEVPRAQMHYVMAENDSS